MATSEVWGPEGATVGQARLLTDAMHHDPRYDPQGEGANELHDVPELEGGANPTSLSRVRTKTDAQVLGRAQNDIIKAQGAEELLRPGPELKEYANRPGPWIH